jgi:RNA 2',3'-cyclic 3'-phosphodiesterase
MSKAAESWRLFIAIEIPKTVRHQIKEHIDRLRSTLPDVRASWTREDNLHLTLEFLGDVPVARVEQLSQALKRAANQSQSFEMEISGCGAFPPRGKPSVLWIGAGTHASGVHPPNEALSPILSLHRAIEDECARIGFEQDQRPFHPHLTIARLRHSPGARRLAELHQKIGFTPITIDMDDVCLIRSELSSAGSRYTIIARHRLG